VPGLMDVLGAALGGGTQQQLGRQIGASPEQTGSAIQAALPMLLAGLHQNAQQPGGAEALLGALQRDHDGSVLSNLSGLLGGAAPGTAGTASQAGNGAGILGHVLGDRQDAAHAAVAQASGLGAGQVALLMTALAPMVMGALGQMQRSQGLNASGVASVLQTEHASAAQAQPGIMGLATQLLGGGGAGAGGLEDVMKNLGGMLGKN
jgi:hypothetical protein